MTYDAPPGHVPPERNIRLDEPGNSSTARRHGCRC
ncbi:Hypothetical protein SLIV_08072 [Streptomyces lividans TK24]|uniref:Uncharacterized protein n=1 Tax=Streptomyces lividans TK24 TaxID=457428 RepID=A0ABX6TNV7_STRLI|nr:Hypothetical protein SLIV_08072 [Streptomyces lividans TK24]QSJ08140.1 Hypothetical protein SLIVDG2_08072 [Streptomyces lividans]QTD69064.1 Hypothetical protein SLIVYQS_08072 [Streptomyces lividans TK24] [Streptomyces lividans]